MKSRLMVVLLVLAVISAALQAAPQNTPVNQVYLYRSPLTAAFFKANGADYGTLLLRWREYLKQYGKLFRQTSRAELLAGLQPGGVLVLGSAVLLDEQERAAIQAYADNGGNILATWGTGARDGKGAWVGYGFIETLVDVKVTGTITRAKEEWFLNIYGDSPINWLVPAGKRVYLGKTSESPLRLTSAILIGPGCRFSTKRPGPSLTLKKEIRAGSCSDFPNPVGNTIKTKICRSFLTPASLGCGTIRVSSLRLGRKATRRRS